ncbi:MAG TPA: hypothetical protein VIL36_15285 [Acidimicrobiales bacterium]
MFDRLLDLDRDYAVGAVYGLVLVVVVACTPLLPRALALTGPILCPGDQQDTIVTTALFESDDPTGTGVRSTGGGVSLFCMGERGETTEAGLLRPVAVLLAGVVALLLALAALWWGLRRAARRIVDGFRQR